MKIKFLLLFIVLFILGNVSSLSVTVHVPEKYTEVYAGERFYFEIAIKYPENPSRKDLRLNFEVEKDGELVAQSKVLKAIETQASFIEFITIPSTAEDGLHTIRVKILDYEDLSEEVSATFNVVSEGIDQLRIYFFILLSAILFVGALVIFALLFRKN